MNSNKKSAKDISFEKERIKYRHKIKDLQYLIQYQDNLIKSLKNDIIEKEEKIEQLNDWIQRLLEYTELSEDEMKKIIDEDKKSIEILDMIAGLCNMFGLFGVPI